jgi:murein DD-endopeptidase MepM/ murein hydrolase activator NlpD
VAQNGNTFNPFSYLASGVGFENCSGSSCGSSDGDIFNPSGSWSWPITPSIKFTQGYGVTWAVRNTWVGRIYSSHNGIDINNETNSEVKAVKGGTLYRGSYGGSGGCRLRYVRVHHDDGGLDTYYLHINY